MNDLVTAPGRRTRSDDQAPTAMDMWVGRRIRSARTSRGLTIVRLATEANLSRQMLEKYEKGDARVSAGRLSDIAVILNVDPGWFFANCPAIKMPTDRPGLDLDDMTTETVDLVKTFLRLKTDQKAAVQMFIEALDRANQAAALEPPA